MDPGYGERYRELFESHWWWRARTELVVDTLRRLQPSAGWRSILDIGCGDGLFFNRLAEFGEVEGIEPSMHLVPPESPHRIRIHLRPFDCYFRPGKQYSLILMLDVLEHLEDPTAALRHVLDLLLPGGTFVATVPAFMFLWTNHDTLNHHFTRYTRRTFLQIANRAGLQITEQRYLYYWTCAAKLVVRVLEGIFPLQPKLPRVPAAVLNAPLYWATRLEQKTLGRLPVPFGSSLLAVCKKPG